MWHAPSDLYSWASGSSHTKHKVHRPPYPFGLLHTSWPNIWRATTKWYLDHLPPKDHPMDEHSLTLISCATPLFTSKIILYLTISPLHLVVEFLITTLWCGNHSSGQPSHSRAGGWRCWEYTTWALIPVVGSTAPRDTTWHMLLLRQQLVFELLIQIDFSLYSTWLITNSPCVEDGSKPSRMVSLICTNYQDWKSKIGNQCLLKKN